MTWSAGIDLGGTNLKAVAVTTDGTVLARLTLPTRDGNATVDDWAAAGREAIAGFAYAQGVPPTMIGICTPGLIAPDGRSILSYPDRLRGLEGFDWAAALTCPAPLSLLNDAHAALLGEAWLGAARGRRHAVLFTLGTGVGGAILSDGKLLRGALGRAGHLGHVSVDFNGPRSIVGMPGAIEMMIGDCTVLARSGQQHLTTEALVAAHLAGDRAASEVWHRSVLALAAAIASAINILDPEIVVIAGGMIKAGDALFTPLAAALDEFEWRPAGHRVPVMAATLGEWAGAVGAARHAFLSHDSR